MTHYQELLKEITSDVGDDAARLAFASHIRSSEPDRARFIEEQITLARQRRSYRGHVYAGDHPLLREHRTEWSKMIAEYARRWTFDRGFVAKIVIEPYLFLEHGEWLMLNHPIQMVEFCKPDDRTFPVSELATCPLLARLEAVTIRDVRLKEEQLEQLITSPHLGRILYMALDCERVSVETYRKIATSVLRNTLVLSVEDEGPEQRYADTGDEDMEGRAVYAWTDVSPRGKALEAEHGYLPWLHPQQNWCEPLDASWFVAQGILPVKPPGSAVT